MATYRYTGYDIITVEKDDKIYHLRPAIDDGESTIVKDPPDWLIDAADLVEIPDEGS